MSIPKTIARALAIAALCIPLAGCDDVRVYGSVGVSSFSGYGYGYGGPGVGTSLTVGGRLY